MSVVSFEQIQRITNDMVDPILAGIIALGPVTGAGDRLTLFDPLWGYFLFGQATSFNHNETEVYEDLAEFAIEGVFTRNAIIATDAMSLSSTDEEIFVKMAERYEALVTLFETKGGALPPDNITLWGTASDPRCIALPEPLRDRQGDVVYAIPVELAVRETQWPNLLSYSARLIEVKTPIAKLIVNDVVLDEGVISIIPRAPELSRHSLMSTSGEVLQLKHYRAETIDVSATLPHDPADGDSLSAKVRGLLLTLWNGQATIKVRYKHPGTGVLTTTTLYTNVDVDGGSIDVSLKDESVSISFKARVL